MSLLDLLEKRGGSGSTSSRIRGTMPYTGGSLGSLPDRGRKIRPSALNADTAARSSRERGVPERINLSDWPTGPVGPGETAPSVPLQTLEVVGRAPGFIAERPLAVADSLLQNEQGESPFDAIGEIPGVKGLGDAINYISGLPGAIANAGTADSLRRGVSEGWSDDTLLVSKLDEIGDGILGDAARTIPGIGGLFGQIAGPKGEKPQSWGEFKADAAKKGWRPEDVQGLIDGTKNTYDFGDKQMSSDPMAEMGLRIGSDPFNLLFGLGAAMRLAKGVGLMAKAIKAGAVAEKFEAPSVVAMKLAANASAAGISASGKGATWLGLAKTFGNIGVAASRAPGVAAGAEIAAKGLTATGKALKAYQKVAIGTTVAQVGLKGLAETPLRGPLAGLFDINERAFNNQPLSQNSAFSLFTAFHFDLTYLAAKGAGQFKGVKSTLLGDDTRIRMLDALAENYNGPGKTGTHAEVLQGLGGPAMLDNLIVHTHSEAAFARVMANPVIKASLSHFDSLDEAMLKNAKLGEMIKTIVADDYKNGRTNGKQTVKGFKDWFSRRSGIDQPRDFDWNGRQAVDHWTQFSGAATSVQQLFRERGGIVLGLVDDLMSEDVWNLQALARIAGGADKAVPVAEIRGWLDRFPTLLDEKHALHKRDAAWWGQFLGREADGTTVPLGKIQGKLKRLGKDAASARDLTREMADAESAASKGEWTAPRPEDYATQGRATINVSRARPGIVRRLKLKTDDIDSVSTSRTDPTIAAFEGRVGQALQERGFRVDDTTQALGSWEGDLEASIEINMSQATLPELRLAAAHVGRAGQQDAVVVTVGGARMRELGLTANGYEVVLSLPDSGRDSMRVVSAALSKEFPGFTINDTTGMIRLVVKEGTEAETSASLARVTAEIDGLYPEDSLGASTVKTSVHPAYVEFIDSKKGEYGNATYTDVIAESRAAGDPRAGLSGEITAALSHKRADASNAGAGLGSPDAVGRDASNGGPATGRLSEPPATRVGLGRINDAQNHGGDHAGYLYHVTKVDALEGIADMGLTPQGAKKLTWADGGTGRRLFYSAAPVDAVRFADQSATQPLLRVAEADAGKVRRDRLEKQDYSAKRIEPSLVEVWGADDRWHRLDQWFEQTVEPEIAAAAAPVAKVYSSPSVARVDFRDRMKAAFELSDDEAGDVAALADARARAWASQAPGRTAEGWYEKNFAAIERGGESGPEAFNQILRRNEGVAAAGDDASLRALMDEPEPDILAEHGLGGASDLEWIEGTNGRSIAIPGGVEGLTGGEFTLWDLWKLKSQGIDPNILPESVRVPLYGKLFRSQQRALTSAPDVFNRMAFAILSPQTNLTQNEALLSFVRAQDEGGIARLAEIADSAGEGASSSEIGFAIQKATGLDTSVDTLGVGIKSITTNGNLGSVGRLAQLMRDDSSFFLLREGEDLLEYSERIMNVTPGAGMKVGNFSAMLGNPIEWDRGTIDSHIVQQLGDEGRLDADVIARLKGDAPTAQEITYRSKKTGEINPDVPAHLRDLPIEPRNNKVLVYGGDYRIANEALKGKFAESGISDFGLGAYQWLTWDLKRGRFEPHTIIYPGSHVLPPIELNALSSSLKAHRDAGYLGSGKTKTLPGMAMSPRDAFFYQEAKAPEPWRRNRYARAGKVELVPVEYLSTLPAGNKLGYTDLDALVEDMRVNGVKEPIPLSYAQDSRSIFMDEGNHRLEAARRLGLKALPVRFVRETGPMKKGVTVPGVTPDEFGYVKGDLSPSDIGVPTVLELNAKTPRWADNDLYGPGTGGPSRPVPGYRLEIEPASTFGEGNRVDGGYRVKALTDSGEIAGQVYFFDTPEGLKVDVVAVGEAHQRKGLATWMYTHAQEQLGKKVLPGSTQSMAGEALWSQPGRTFGQGADTIIKGSTQFLEDNRAVMRGLESPDVSTGIHEVAHVIANELDDADLEIVRRVHGANPEGMPRDFERWLREGKASVPELNDVFKRMRAALIKIYTTLRGSPLEKKIHPEMRAMFERLFAEVEPENTGMFDPTPDTLTAGLRAMGDEITAPGQVLWMASRDAEVSSSIPFHRSLAELDGAGKAELASFEQNLRTHYPAYTLQKAPNPAIMLFDQGDIATRYLRNRTMLGNVLADYGPMGKVNHLLDWLVSPVHNSDLGRAAKASLMNELIPHGATPIEVGRFIQALNTESQIHTIGRLETRLFGSGKALLPQTINRIAGGDKRLGIQGIFSEKTVAAIGRDNFARVMDRSSNRFIRTLDERAAKGGAKGQLSRAVAGMYGSYQKTLVGDTTRLVGKTLYPIFRFIADPRWWAMNILEADFIAGTRYGASATRIRGAHRAPEATPSLLHRGDGAAKQLDDTFGDQNGMMWTRGHAGYISRSFDAARPETTLEALRALPDTDPVLIGLREVIEAHDAQSGTIRTPGELVDADYVQAIDRLLYEVDVKGAKVAVTDEAVAILGHDETSRLMPFLQKVWERNDATHQAITKSLTGNTSRSNLERIGNSYWLYWPLSYQIKATKWLVDIMTNRFMGAKTNLAPAALYAHQVEEHRKRLATDPEYVQMFADSQTMWFAAQMIFPMTPGDMGVSLSRLPRYIGGHLGIWGAYKDAEDPITAAGALLEMGPTYTSNLLARAGGEVFPTQPDNLAP